MSRHEASCTRDQLHFHGIAGAPSGLLPSAQQTPDGAKFVGSPAVASALKISLFDGGAMLMVILLLQQFKLLVVNRNANQSCKALQGAGRYKLTVMCVRMHICTVTKDTMFFRPESPSY